MLKLKIDQKLIVKILFTTLVLLTILNIGFWTIRYFSFPILQTIVTIFDFDSEANLPTLFSTLLLLLNAAILFLIGCSRKKNQARTYRQWLLWSALFVFMGIDESSQIHEAMMDLIKNHIETSGFFYFAWIIPAAIFVFIFALINIKFLRSLPKSTFKYFALAGAVYLVGAVGIEAIGGYYVTHFDGQSFTYRMITTVEEFFEMLGLIIFCKGLLRHFSQHFSGVSMQLIDSNKE